jgi:hypothetical protein
MRFTVKRKGLHITPLLIERKGDRKKERKREREKERKREKREREKERKREREKERKERSPTCGDIKIKKNNIFFFII